MKITSMDKKCSYCGGIIKRHQAYCINALGETTHDGCYAAKYIVDKSLKNRIKLMLSDIRYKYYEAECFVIFTAAIIYVAWKRRHDK